MGIKYIRNTDDASIGCKIPSLKKSFLFKPKKFDKRNNILLSNGYTEISDEDIELLRKESTVFTYYEKLGRLSVGDNLPQEAMSTEQLVASLRTEIAALKQELKAKPVSGDSSKELKNALAIIEEQRETMDKLSAKVQELSTADSDDSLLAEKLAEIDELKEENQRQQDLIDVLNAQLAEETVIEKEEDK